MTETRKQMYKILDKYMDKTPGIGCTYKVNGNYDLAGNFEYNEKNICLISENRWCITCCEIIGHYEIGAVIRCIDDLGEIEYDSGNKFAIYNYTASNYLGIIENKPLQLWTTEEEQNFINITKELG